MDKIEVGILNPEAIKEAEKMCVCAARLTQRGHQINSLDDFKALYDKPYTESLVRNLTKLPHPTIQKFGTINVVIVGASRRFLAQITRHQNEVKFMSASLQYSDYSDNNNFCVPSEIIEAGPAFVEAYKAKCAEQMKYYANFAKVAGNDAAGYLAPQGLRNILIISATPYQWKHMIRQRTCRRNTKETEFVMLKIWKELHAVSPELFGDCGPFCTRGKCEEGKMCCMKPMKKNVTPSEVLEEDFHGLLL